MTTRSPTPSTDTAPNVTAPGDDFNALLGPLMQEYPLLFEMEVLNRLSVPDHFALAGVSREARAAMFTFEPIAFLTRDNFMPHEDIRHQCRYACTEACKEGRVDVLRWLTLDPSYEMDRRGSYHAARNGHVHVLEWLLDEGCSLAEDAASGAAEGGHLEALKWLVNHGCPWSGSVWNYAVKGRHVEVMEWLRAEGCGGC